MKLSSLMWFALLAVSPVASPADYCAPLLAEIDDFSYAITEDSGEMVVRVEVPLSYRNLTFEKFELQLFSREEALKAESSRAMQLEHQARSDRVAAEIGIKGEIHKYYYLRALYSGDCTSILVLRVDPGRASVERISMHLE